MEQNRQEQQAMPKDRAILVGVNFTSDRYDDCNYASLDELEGLLDTAGGICCGKLLQNKDVPEAATFLGEGKVQELRELVQLHQANLVVFDNELSPTQIRNLERELETRVMDRSMLILDIFAMRAVTREGKLQVELAQLKYMAPRLTTSYEALSRLGGGVGTRGPGESKLETDRRRIRERITALTSQLKEVEQVRSTMRKARQKNPVPLISVIGYTNAGKSTLFNRLTGADVLEENRLFATLDTTVRKVRISDNCEALISDTVGFIKKLPHHLVEAFHSTLEEMVYSDLILHVIDVSAENWEENEQVSLETMRQVGVQEVPILTVFNKCDLVDLETIPGRPDSVFVSARTGENFDALLKKMDEMLSRGKRQVVLLVPYSEGRVVDLLHQKNCVLEENYEGEGTRLVCLLDGEMYGRMQPYEQKEEA